MGDTISRRAAIETSLEFFVEFLGGAFHENAQKELIARFQRLPSAQPEIIRCKDCKHRMPYDWMFSEIWQSQNMDFYPEDEIGCAYCDMSMTANDFCSRAERRTDG